MERWAVRCAREISRVVWTVTPWALGCLYQCGVQQQREDDVNSRLHGLRLALRSWCVHLMVHKHVLPC